MIKRVITYYKVLAPVFIQRILQYGKIKHFYYPWEKKKKKKNLEEIKPPVESIRLF